MMFFSQVRIRPNISHSTQLKQLIDCNTYGIHQLLWTLFPDKEKRSFLYREEIAREQLGSISGVKGESVFYIVSKEEPAGDTSLLDINRKRYSPILKSGDKLAFKLRANPTVSRKCAGRKNSVRHDVVMDSQQSLLKELLSDMGVSPAGKKSALKRDLLKAFRSSGNQYAKDRLKAVVDKNDRFKNRLSRKLDLEELLELALKSNADKALEGWLVNKGAKSGFALAGDNERGCLKFQAESYRWHDLAKKGKAAGFSSVDFDGVLNVTEPGLFINTLFNGIGSAKGFGCGLMMVRRI